MDLDFLIDHMKRKLPMSDKVGNAIVAELEKSRELQERVKDLEKYEQQMKTLRDLCGYVEDGSNDSVTLSQDDATGIWHITVGYSPRSRKSFWDESFDGVFLKAKSYAEALQATCKK